jgi:hypothetical protein
MSRLVEYDYARGVSKIHFAKSNGVCSRHMVSDIWIIDGLGGTTWILINGDLSDLVIKVVMT